MVCNLIYNSQTVSANKIVNFNAPSDVSNLNEVEIPQHGESKMPYVIYELLLKYNQVLSLSLNSIFITYEAINTPSNNYTASTGYNFDKLNHNGDNLDN